MSEETGSYCEGSSWKQLRSFNSNAVTTGGDEQINATENEICPIINTTILVFNLYLYDALAQL